VSSPGDTPMPSNWNKRLHPRHGLPSCNEEGNQEEGNQKEENQKEENQEEKPAAQPAGNAGITINNMKLI
jgi:hypothetical protein